METGIIIPTHLVHEPATGTGGVLNIAWLQV